MLAMASGSSASASLASAGCVASESRLELAEGMKMVGVEVQVEVDDKVGVEVENEVTQFSVGTPVEVWLVRSTVDDDVGVSAGLTTMYDELVVGEGVFVTSCVRIISTVFAGSISVTIFVAILVSIDGGVLLAGIVTVSILSEVWMMVTVSDTGAAGDVTAESPSTATTEYATRLRTAGCFGGARGFSGKA